MKALQIFALALLMLALGGCGKASDGINSQKCLLNTADETASNGRYGAVYTYNTSRQLSKMIGTSRNYGYSIAEEFTYAPTQIEMKVVPPLSPSVNLVSGTYLLNSAGYITKITRVVKQSPYQFLTFFEYNADGRLSKKTNDDGTYRTFEYKNGDLSVERLYDSKGTLTTTNTYIPDPDKTGADLPMEVSEESAFYVLGLFGKPASHPAKQMTSTANKSSTDYYATDYTHSFDPINNMTSKLATTNLKSISSSTVYFVSTLSTNYTYLCQ